MVVCVGVGSGGRGGNCRGWCGQVLGVKAVEGWEAEGVPRHGRYYFFLNLNDCVCFAAIGK